MAVSGGAICAIVLLIILVVLPLFILSWVWYTTLSIVDTVTELPGGECIQGEKTVDCKDVVTTWSYVKAFAPCTFGIILLICVMYMAMSGNKQSVAELPNASFETKG